MPIQLYDLCGADSDLRFSPHCWKARLALAHKGLAHETIPVPFTSVPGIGGGDFTTTVPVIVDQGRMVRDSFAIAEYLDRTYSDQPLFATGGIAIARFLEASVQAAAHPVVIRMIAKDIHDALAPADQAYFRQSREKRFGSPLDEVQEGVEALSADLAKAYTPVRRALAHAQWLGGSGPLFVDYIAAGALIWLYAITGKAPLAADDAVGQWFDRILDLYGGLVRNTKIAATAR